MERGVGNLGTLLHSRVGRRLLVLFLGCALTPLIAFGWMAFVGVTGELNAETDRALHTASKNAGMHLARSLMVFRDDLELARTPSVATDPEIASLEISPPVRRRLGRVFRSVHVRGTDDVEVLVGAPARPLEPFDARAREHLATGRQLLTTVAGRRHLALVARIVPDDPDSALLVGELDPQVIWDLEAMIGSGSEVVVLDESLRPLASSLPTGVDVTPLLQQVPRSPSAGTVELEIAGEPYLARYWRVFMRPQFGRDLIVVQCRSRLVATAALTGFERGFVLVALLACLAVLLMGVIQVRRVVGPVTALHRATMRLAAGDFETTVLISSLDEFGDLGRAFNDMAAQLLESTRRRQQTEQDLTKARDDALAAARVKSEFLTNVSHELRTPLTSILGSAEILSQHDDDIEMREEFVTMIQLASQQLAGLIDDILELNGPVQLRIEAVDIGSSLRDAIAAFVGDRGEVQLEVVGEVPPARASLRHLQQVWQHLLDNALKFGGGKPVQVVLRRAGERCVVEIRDRGPGIAPDDIERVFEPFVQVCDDILTGKAPGAGLGLTLARNFIERMGGLIELDSGPGAGTTVRVALPLALHVGVEA